MKGSYSEMSEYHALCMKPLTNLIASNVNFHRLENMIKAKHEVPEFRYLALEEEFCKFLTGVCEILREYGNLEDVFDIRQMIKTLKIEKWKECVPFAYYLNPLNDNITVVRKTLLDMHKKGHLLIKYVVEHNTEL